jgi:hypothetical protein
MAIKKTEVLMEIDEAKTALNAHVKKAMQKHLLSLTWEQKVASIERMNAAGKLACEAMVRGRQRETATQQS